MIPSCVYAMSLSPRAGTPCHRPPSHRRARMTTWGITREYRRSESRVSPSSIRENRLENRSARLGGEPRAQRDQAPLELFGGGGTARDRLVESGAEEVAEQLVLLGAGLGEVGAPAVTDAAHQLLHVAAGEDLAAEQAFVEHDGEAPEVERGVGRLAVERLGREIGEGADELLRHRHRGGKVPHRGG